MNVFFDCACQPKRPGVRLLTLALKSFVSKHQPKGLDNTSTLPKEEKKRNHKQMCVSGPRINVRAGWKGSSYACLMGGAVGGVGATGLGKNDQQNKKRNQRLGK